MTFAPEAHKTAGVLANAGIYIASKTKHAHRWRRLRDVAGYPINSTWIDEAGPGESTDLADLWRRCIAEASSSAALIVYREGDEVLKGGWIELGAALASGVPVLAVGIEEFTVAKDARIRHFRHMREATREALRLANAASRSTPSAPSVAELSGDGLAQSAALGAAAVWQPIETAPKDGTPILAAASGTAWVGIVAHAQHKHRGHPWRHGHSVGRTAWHEPTHWMPLPPPAPEGGFNG